MFVTAVLPVQHQKMMFGYKGNECLYILILLKREKEVRFAMYVYTRAREPLPLLWPQWCEWTASKCNTFCGYCQRGQCAFAKYEEPPNLEGGRIIDARDWYLQEIIKI